MQEQDVKTTRLHAFDEVTLAWDLTIGAHAPSNRRFHVWLYQYHKDIVIEAIASTAAKYQRNPQMTANDLERYATATCKHIQARIESEAAETVQ